MKNKESLPISKYKMTELLFMIAYWIIMVRFVIVFNSFGFINDTAVFDIESKAFQFLKESLILGTIAGFCLGLLTGLLELYVFRNFFRNRAFYKLIISKILIYLLSIFLITIWAVYGYQWFYKGLNFDQAIIETMEIFVSRGFYQILFIGLFLSLGLNFLLITKNNIGHRIFIPILLGKYHIPKEENRIFTFIDLKSSTHSAEVLGHVQYSRMLQDCFRILSELVVKNNGSIYQFVGDEAVITWSSKKKRNFHYSIQLFKEFKASLIKDQDYFLKNYNMLPTFKAASHCGAVMVAEVGGSIKSEIAYHGDVLNTTARMMELCKPFETDFLVSDDLMLHIDKDICEMQFKYKGELELRGKDMKTKVFSST